jgi:hypothetical protein
MMINKKRSFYINISEKVRECTSCGERKTFSEFDKCTSNKSGVTALCRECRSRKEREVTISRGKRAGTRHRKRAYISITDRVRECICCREIKDFSKFDRCSRNLSGVHEICKECRSAEGRKRTISRGKQVRVSCFIDYDNKLKACTCCKEVKSFSEFSARNTGNARGLYSQCKTCCSSDRKKREEVRVAHLSEFLQTSGSFVCIHCGEEKDIKFFGIDVFKKRGRSSICNVCRNLSVSMLVYTPDYSGVKVCSVCGVEKSKLNFYRNPRVKDGLFSECMQCTYAARRRHIARHVTVQLALLLRSRLSGALRNCIKIGSSVRDLGCSVEQLRIFLENKFYPHPDTGEIMSWENRGRSRANSFGHYWEIDHIQPLSSFDLTDRDQFLMACHYTNLQPLWNRENREKSGKSPEEYQEYRVRKERYKRRES